MRWEENPSPPGALRLTVGLPAAPSSPDRFAARWRHRRSCRRLDRLAEELGRKGWDTLRRYEQSPPALRVYRQNLVGIGESVTVVRGTVIWWYRSSSGAWLGPCIEPWRAVESVTALLGLWGITAGLYEDPS
jgi:hypothetical protein